MVCCRYRQKAFACLREARLAEDPAAPDVMWEHLVELVGVDAGEAAALVEGVFFEERGRALQTLAADESAKFEFVKQVVARGTQGERESKLYVRSGETAL